MTTDLRTEPSADLGTALLAHEVRGEGDETILLLNGGMMTYAAWTPISDDLATDHRVVLCDLRGQLRSPGDSHSRLEDHLPDLISLLDHLGLERVHVMGTSFGGEVGLLLAAHHPERVRSLAAVTAADRTPDGMAENARKGRRLAREVMQGRDGRDFFDAVVVDIYPPEWRQANAEIMADRRERSALLPPSWYQGLVGILTAIEDFDFTPWLGTIRCPTLVVHAANDTVMHAERVRALAAAIPGAELRVHPSASHVLVLEDPTWLLDTYRDFLTRKAKAA